MIVPQKGVDYWRLLRVFQSEIRVEIAKLLLRCEMATLSEILTKLEHDHGWKLTPPGVLKHMRKLENAGIVRSGSGGIILPKPDARKTVYLLEGKERVKKIVEQLDTEILKMLQAGMIFSKARMLSRKIDICGVPRYAGEKKHLDSLISECESEKVNSCLTEDEKRNVKLWRMLLKLLE